MEKIIKEKIAILQVRLERFLEILEIEHVTESFKEFYKNKFDTTYQQIILLQEILSAKK